MGILRCAQDGGERGIRTLEPRKGLHDFESCAFDHSAISPWPRVPDFLIHIIESSTLVPLHEYPSERRSFR